MRVTHRMIIENAIRSMSDNLQKLGDLQSRASSGKKFDVSSDHPRASRSALALRSSIQTNQGYLETIQAAEGWLNASQNALGNLERMGIQAVNAALEGVSDTNSEARQILAQKLDGLIEEGISTANVRHLDSYLFSGFKVNTEPFTLTSGSPDTVSFSGDQGVIQRAIAPDRSLTVNFDADAVISPFFSALISARDALLLDDTSGIQAAVEDLQSAQEGITEQMAINGTRLKETEESTAYLEETQLTLRGLLSREEDIDLVEIITELRHQETVYQTTLEVGHRTLAAVNLFDLLK